MKTFYNVIFIRKRKIQGRIQLTRYNCVWTPRNIIEGRYAHTLPLSFYDKFTRRITSHIKQDQFVILTLRKGISLE